MVGTHLKHARLAAGLSQEEAAHRAGIDRTSWSRIERGTNSPTLDVFVAMCRAVDARPGLVLASCETDSLRLHPPSSTSLRAVLAASLRHARAVRNWSQRDLAAAASMHQSAVSAIENEKRDIGLDTLEQIAEALGVAASELLAQSDQ